MALNWQNVPISLQQGLDTKTDFKQVVPGKLLYLQNGIFLNPGKIRKRYGNTQITSLSQGSAISSYLDELDIMDGTSLYSYSISNQSLTNKGHLTSVELALTPIIRNSYQQQTPDMAQHPSGLQIFTWEDSRGGIWYSVVDSVTGNSIVNDQQILSTGIKPKAFTIGGYLGVFYGDTVTHNIFMTTIPVLTPMVPSTITIASDVSPTYPNYDATVVSTKVYIAWNNSSGGTGISFKSINAFLVASSESSVSGENADVAIAVIPNQSPQQIWVAYYNGTEVKYFIRNSSLGAVLAPTTIETLSDVVRVIGVASGTSGQVWYEVSAGLTYNTLIRTATVNSTGTVGTPAVFLRSVGIAAKPFTFNSVVYLPVTFSSVQQPTIFIVSSTGYFIAKAIQENGGGLLVDSIVPESILTSDNLVEIAILNKDIFTTISGSIYTQTGVVYISLDFSSLYTYQRTTLANDLHITGGMLQMYDGGMVVEHGFNVYPEEVTTTSSTMGGNLGSASVATQYQYSVTYEWTDNQGQIHRSFPSIPDSNTTINFASGVDTGMVILTIPTLRLTEKTNVLIVIYRTQGNGTNFTQVTSITAPLRNDPTVDSVMYTDTASDASILGNPLLYTTGGVLGDDQAPASILSTYYEDRLLIIPADSRRCFWYSKQIIPGSPANPGNPVEFSEEFIWNIDQRGGDITSFYQMDTNLILFKENFIYAMTGQGPDSTGASNDFTEAYLVSTDSGSIEPAATVLMPSGLMYKSSKGIYLLSRSLQVSYIGADVEGFNNDTITSAQLIPTVNQVRFTTTAGVTLVYDYYVGQWSVFTNLNNDSALDSTIFQDLFTFIQIDGQVLQETTNVYTDNGAFIPLLLTTSWLSMAQLQGYQRVRKFLLLGEYISPHQLLCSIAYDFDSTVVQQDLVDASTLFSIDVYGQDSPYGNEYNFGGNVPLYEFEIRFQRQKCTAVQMTFQDVQTSNFGEGLSLSAFNLMVGTKKGFNKMPQPNIFS
jgi:hypothetical protein